jgi:AcrR family transcriptional regulator
MTSTAASGRSDHGDLTGRILDAARRLVLQSGMRKLSLSEVATVAGVSRQSIYRYFLSKEELIDALAKHEHQRFNLALERAIEGLVGQARLEAALDVVATVLHDQPPRRVVDLEPRFAHDQIVGALPMITEALVGVIRQCRRDGMKLEAAPPDIAAAIARTVLSHYSFPDQDLAAARRQIRAIVGLPTS